MTDRRPMVFSAHLGDAIRYCWHLLASGDVEVVNVFTGMPRPEERMRKRLSEDRAALALAKIKPMGLGFRERDRRDEEEPEGALGTAVATAAADAGIVYAPAALRGDVDRGLVRDALRDAIEPRRLRLYADLSSVEVLGARVLGSLPAVHRLNARDAERKLRAVRLYRSLADSRNADGDGSAQAAIGLRYEAAWPDAPGGLRPRQAQSDGAPAPQTTAGLNRSSRPLRG